jgi:sugar phosphate isomerase/epimerase
MFPADAAHRSEVIDDNRRAIDEAAALGSPCLVLVVGGLPQFSRPGSLSSSDIAAAREEVIAAIAELLDYADKSGVPLAIEPLHPMYAADRACVNTLGQALDICEALDPDGTHKLGIVVDVYHVWWDPNVFASIRRAGSAERIHAFHISDWLVPTATCCSTAA